MTWLRLSIVACIMSTCLIGYKAVAQTNNEVYEQHACGSIQGSLKARRQFFFSRWQARSAELHDLARDAYTSHHGITADHVYIFQSLYFKKLAVVAAEKRGEQQVLCIVKVDGRYHKEYTPDEIHKILSTEKAI